MRLPFFFGVVEIGTLAMYYWHAAHIHTCRLLDFITGRLKCYFLNLASVNTEQILWYMFHFVSKVTFSLRSTKHHAMKTYPPHVGVKM